MNRLTRLAGVLVLLSALTMVDAPRAAAGEVVRPTLPKGSKVPSPSKPPRPSMSPPQTDLPKQEKPSQPTTPPAPPALGWPHAISSGNPTACSREPLAHEVLIYDGEGFAGACAVLTAGFYPAPPNLRIGDNKLSSIKVGSGVRARVYHDPTYGGTWTLYPASTRSAGLNGFNNNVSSMRVEPNDRSSSCNDTRDGEVAVFERSYGNGDCVVLPGDGAYANAESMGLRDDGISAVVNNSARKLTLYWDPSFSRAGFELPPHSQVDHLPGSGWTYDGIDDNASSMRGQ